MGQSFLDYAIDPFILGVYAGDPNRLVPKYALPKLYNLEHDFGSFIGGTIRKSFIKKTEDEKKVTRNVFSVKGGLSSLTNAIYKKIGTETVLLESRNIEVKPLNNHFIVTFINKEGKPVEIETKKVISTVGAYQVNKIAPFIGRDHVSRIQSLHYTKVIEVVLGFDRWDGLKLDAFGGLIPYKEDRDILGILFMSALLGKRAPENGALFSIFLGGVRNPEIYLLPDHKVEEIIKKEVRNLMHLNEFKPDLFKIIRHEYAIPQYEADSGNRFMAIEEVEKGHPGFIIGGNLRNGIGMADRILQAKMLAEAVLQ